ncbi:hypothetical protein H072_2335 [Dactylellina haptotyla CBS 200.50]|uniref:Ribonuclease H1 N-terminal domain-containing protein n=1 Tax=Dactylellina haptotyla (strain CBS 200.50) TaxID=1284197 RepID=S8AKX7_DACHA|nr:hypothetical protein H072_2335 [Dactylellina haptotyla CBS 200.50]
MSDYLASRGGKRYVVTSRRSTGVFDSYKDQVYPSTNRYSGNIHQGFESQSDAERALGSEARDSYNGPYWAVKNGRSRHIYPSWIEAAPKVLGYSHNEHRRFETYEKAKEWLDSDQEDYYQRVSSPVSVDFLSIDTGDAGYEAENCIEYDERDNSEDVFKLGYDDDNEEDFDNPNGGYQKDDNDYIEHEIRREFCIQYGDCHDARHGDGGSGGYGDEDCGEEDYGDFDHGDIGYGDIDYGDVDCRDDNSNDDNYEDDEGYDHDD